MKRRYVSNLIYLLIIVFFVISACSNKPSEKEIIIGEWDISNIKIIKNNNVLQTFIINENTTVQFLHSNVFIDEYKYNYEFLDDNKIQIFDDNTNQLFYIEIIDENSIVLKNKLLEINLKKYVIKTVNIYYSN